MIVEVNVSPKFLRFNMDIRHIKITSTEGLYRINDKKAFKGLIVSPTSSKH